MKFNKLVSIVLIFAIILSVTAGCSNAATTTTEAFQIPDNFTTYSDETSVFSISYPNQWEPMSESDLTALYSQVKDDINAIKSGAAVDKASLLFLAGLKTSGGYYPNVDIAVEPEPTLVVTNDLAVQAEINGLKQADPNYQEVSRKKITTSGKTATILEYKAHFSDTGPLMHDYLLICLSGKNIWTVTCTATDTDYTLYSSDFNNILRSFQITK